MNSLKPRYYIYTLFVLLFSIMIASSGYSQQDSSITEEKLNLDDGPHVLWKNDSTARVFYYCDEEVISKQFDVDETLRFNGLCNDSLVDYIIPNRTHKISPFIHNTNNDVFCMSDIHGDFDHLVEILINAKVIDKNFDWIYGKNHFVITGDVFDRGPNVTECLWLLYKLELQAEVAGGMVHLLLGNHEFMVLRDDLRYVNDRYKEGISHRWRFKYRELFGPNTELGRWLRSKNTVEIINDVLYLHGGISPMLIEKNISIEKINDLMRKVIDYSSLEIRIDTEAKYLYSSEGPVWYRGYHYEMENKYPMITPEEVDQQLKYFGVNHIVIGHTQQDSIRAFFDGKIIAIDVVVEDIDSQQALLWEKGKAFKIHGDGSKSSLK